MSEDALTDGAHVRAFRRAVRLAALREARLLVPCARCAEGNQPELAGGYSCHFTGTDVYPCPRSGIDTLIRQEEAKDERA